MEAAEVPVPERTESWWDVEPNLLAYARHHHADLPTRPHEAGEVAHIEVVGPEVVIGVHAEGGVKEPRGEGQSVGLGVDGEDEILETSLPDAPQVVGGRNPEVGCPYLDAELPGQKDRAERLAAAHVEHT